MRNVGKSTLFNCLSNAKAQNANFPFCTIVPNIGMVNVPDSRLTTLEGLVNPERVVPATVEIVDIAGLVKGASNLLGVKAMMEDLGVQAVPLHVHSDSSAAIGIASRTGLGKLRHLEVHLLWVQDHVRRRNFALAKIDGKANPADLLTKHLGQDDVWKCAGKLSMAKASGRAEVAPAMLGT